MNETYQVLEYTDEENKTHYTKEQSFEAGSDEAKQAFKEYTQLVMLARMYGYSIKKIEEKNKETIDDELMEQIDEKTSNLGV